MVWKILGIYYSEKIQEKGITRENEWGGRVGHKKIGFLAVRLFFFLILCSLFSSYKELRNQKKILFFLILCSLFSSYKGLRKQGKILCLQRRWPGRMGALFFFFGAGLAFFFASRVPKKKICARMNLGHQKKSNWFYFT